MTTTPTRDGPAERVPRLALDEARRRAEAAGMDPAMADIHLFQVLLHAPHAGAAIDSTKDTLLIGTTLDWRLRELAIMRIAWLLGAEYVWNHHTRSLVQHELALCPDDVLEVRDWEHSTTLGQVERAVLGLTDGMVLNRSGAASADAVQAVVDVLPLEQVIELTVTIALYRGITGVIQTLAIPMETSYGRWEPDGVAPPWIQSDGSDTHAGTAGPG